MYMCMDIHVYLHVCAYMCISNNYVHGHTCVLACTVCAHMYSHVMCMGMHTSLLQWDLLSYINMSNYV